MTRVRGLVPKIGAGIDVFFIAAWWWRYRRQRAEHRLSEVLERYGDESHAARWATEKWQDMEFAVRFWRPAARPVQQVVRNAAACGVPIDALRFAITSRALGVKDARVVLKRSYALLIVCAAVSLVVLGETVVACAMILVIPGQFWLLKCGLLVAVAGLNLMAWRAWVLWWIQPRRAIKQWGIMLERSCNHARYAKLIQLRAFGR